MEPSGASRCCYTRPGADALDQELAERLNERPGGKDSPDSTGALRAVLTEAALWGIGGVVMLIAAFYWLV